jgi:predicted TPR repeat methyltransferase
VLRSRRAAARVRRVHRTELRQLCGELRLQLAKLSYRAPALVAEMLKRSGVDPSKRVHILDAGCGTGLCGPLVAPYACRLVGVDLSEGMLARARERDVYDVLVKGELTAYLEACTDTFDVIVSADTLVYFGAARRRRRCRR